ncbi:RGG repeats nuclear RNA binding protein A [Phytophthora citrophthora]|uniref:RGG repeats nuclear RNA binding protein A n=1 Tax=Phytophthora citrophthora TaxID=4793 RepID=A0AAD9LTN9_9STRA|nr:RGG repeats nuclear RNA binding protein A [Phytophthora citrophthora]
MLSQSSKNFFAALDSDDEDTPRVNKKATPPPSAPVALNKPAAGNKKAGNKKAPAGDKKESRGPRDGGRAPRERGERGDRGRGNRGPRREFERRSGTGRGKETSKQGGGARNWGNKADPNEQLAEAAAQEGAKPASDEEAAEEAAAEEEEEEEVQLTLDEYMAKQKSSRSGELFAEVEVRQVTNEFSSAVQITKEGKTPDFMDSQYEKVYSKKTSGRKKQVITDVGFRSEKPERFTRDFDSSRGGRGGRGGRGARGNGRTGGRSGRGANAPNVTDMNAFPSLG